MVPNHRKMLEPPSTANQFHAEHIDLLLESYQRFVGHVLIERAEEVSVAEQIFLAPFVVVSHGTEEDPIFNYGNRAALALFEFEWPDFTALPSRRSAEPQNRAERARLLEAVTKYNFIDDYQGVRISSSGKRFHIPRAVVWNVIDTNGVYRGQAATFADWRFLTSSTS